MSDYRAALLCHPNTPAPTVRELQFELSRNAAGDLSCIYTLSGDISRLKIPCQSNASPNKNTFCDGLWAHTCFEIFIASADSTAYQEFNFSPAGQWASYAFSDYRQALASTDASAHAFKLHAPRIVTEQTAGHLRLSASINAAALSEARQHSRLHIGVSAVVESADLIDDALSYWALKHPSADQNSRPDFHQRSCFILELGAQE